MNRLEEIQIHCPYCGEPLDILVDGSVEEQEYIEDCQVCCRPIDIQTHVSAAGDIQVIPRHEDEA